MSTTEAPQEAVTLEQRLMEAVDWFRARLRDIVVGAVGAPVPTESTLEHVLAIIRNVDEWLDSDVSVPYRAQPLSQDWARVAKVAEEVGEAIDALIGCTGQNPRKGHYGEVDDLLAELADVAVTGMLAIQHFTKDNARTASIVMASLEKAAGRAAEAGYGEPSP